MEADHDLQEVLSLLDLTDDDKALVQKASDFAKERHKDHKRMSGEPYYNHLFETARSLAEIGMGARTIAAGFLHDCIEDVDVEEEEIEDEFGSEILFLVQGVTKLGTLRYHGAQRHTESLRRLFVATSRDIRVVIIKLMDRLHNMKTLDHINPEKRKRIAQETLEVYAPIADRLGMGRLKHDLEDLAFKYVEPEAYEQMKDYITQRGLDRDVDLEDSLRELKREFAKHHITSFRTEYRIKGLYSLYKKLERKEKDIEKIHDILAIRIIVSSIDDCYRVLGVVHGLWRPIPGKIKDYIAFPKPNGYRSIHTTIFAGKSGVVEIQIRTEEMHREAQYGVASHFVYKESGGSTPQTRETNRSNKLWFQHLIPSVIRGEKRPMDTRPIAERNVPNWIREIADSHSKENSGPERFIEGLRTDFFSHRVFVFTPKGDVIDLPIDSSPIDFAYAIHSDIGNHMCAAKVNGKLSALDSKLKNGDIVEIETRPDATPSQKWLDQAKTTLAKRHIQNALQKMIAEQ